MKKIVLTVILLSLICTSFSGCIHWETPEIYELMHDDCDIKSIRVYSANHDSEVLYDYSNPDDPCGKLLGEIPSIRYAAFAEELAELPFVEQHMILLLPVTFGSNFYYGEFIIKVEYHDGSCELISEIIQRQFRANAKYPETTRYGTDKETWLLFLQNWVDISDSNNA